MMRRPDFFLVIDIEATCDNKDRIPPNESEIIELGAVMVDGLTYDLVDEFQSFVRPIRHSQLTDFCKDLTTIRQIEVDIAPRFDDVLPNFVKWLKPYSQYLFCSWGVYDKIQIERDCYYHRLDYPLGKQHFNMREAYAKRWSLPNPVGMLSALRRSKVHMVGTHHRGIDDARNIAKLLPHILH